MNSRPPPPIAPAIRWSPPVWPCTPTVWPRRRPHFEAASTLEPKNDLFRMSVAILRMASTNKTEQFQSRAVLEKLRTDDSLGLLVLRALVADRLLHKDVAAAMFTPSNWQPTRAPPWRTSCKIWKFYGSLKAMNSTTACKPCNNKWRPTRRPWRRCPHGCNERSRGGKSRLVDGFVDFVP